MPSAVGYCRVSSEEQAAHGISVSAQRDILNGYAAMTQSAIRIFEDAGFSGKNTARPGLQAMLDAVRAGGVETVVVWKLDRLSRSLRDTLTMIEDVFQPLRVRLVSITESIDTSSPSGRMMLNMLAAFAQLEREQDSDRVVMAHKHLARDCRYLGGHVPLGYTVDDSGHYQLDLATAPIVRRVFEMYITRCGYTQILDYLNSNVSSFGHRKNPFSKSDLKYLLHNEFYAGTYIRRMGQDKRSRITSPEIIRVPGGVPAVISQEEWRKVMGIREDNRAARTGAMYKSGRRAYPLSGLVYCSVCGSLMRLEHGGKDRNGTIQRYYTCKDKHVRPVRLEAAEAAVFSAVESLLEDESALIGACRIANNYASAADEDNKAEIADLESRLQGISKKSARLLAFVESSGSDAPASIMTELKALDAEAEILRTRIAACQRPSSYYDAPETLSALRAVLDIKNSPPEQQKPVIQAAIRRVLVSDDNIQIQPAWHIGCGDDPPHPICHTIKRIPYRRNG